MIKRRHLGVHAAAVLLVGGGTVPAMANWSFTPASLSRVHHAVPLPSVRTSHPGRTLAETGHGYAVACRGYSTGLRLRLAVPLIVPSGWSVSFKPGAPRRYEVSWGCGASPPQSWTSLLRQLFVESKASGIVNWHTRTVVVYPAGHAGAPAGVAGGAGKADGGSISFSKSSAAPAIKSTPLAPPGGGKSAHAGHSHKPDQAIRTTGLSFRPVSVAPTWTLRVNHPVSEELMHWAGSAGWHVRWNGTRDWVVPVTTTMRGSFVTVARTLLHDLNRQGAKIDARFYYGNKTLVVTEPGSPLRKVGRNASRESS